MTDRELMQQALDDLIDIKVEDGIDCVTTILALRSRLAQPEPVAMKFQIYRPTPPRGRELDPINSGLLPWVYDQDPSSGNIASMWVTPVAPLPPQRKPDEQIGITYEEANPPQPHCERCGKKLGTEMTDNNVAKIKIYKSPFINWYLRKMLRLRKWIEEGLKND